MIWTYLLKVACIVLMVFLSWCTGKLFRVFEKYPKDAIERSWIAYGILSEVIIIIELAIKLITG